MTSHADAAGAVLLAGLEGVGISADERAFFERVPCAGVTIFKRNIPTDSGGLVPILAELQSLRPRLAPPLIVAIDQEGGRVDRFHGDFINLGPPMQLAEGKCEPTHLDQIRNYARTVGLHLAQLGVNVNFAPVVDILTEPTNTAIGNRCFGTDADSVVRRAGSFLRGLGDSGIKACLKHFPGQGDAKYDTHFNPATIEIDFDQLWQRELVPYRQLAEWAPMIMISHCIYPALSKEPASLSLEVMTGLLRKRMGYSGLIVSDDMNMEALPQDAAVWAEKLVAALAAGADLLLVCRKIEKCQLAFAALVREAQRSSVFARRLDDAAHRVLALRHSLSA